MNNEAGRELLMNAIQGNGTAINQLASSLNCSTQQLQNAICQIQGQIQQVGKERNANTQFNILSSKIDAQTQIIQSGFCELEKRDVMWALW